jgi:hypothetical protein
MTRFGHLFVITYGRSGSTLLQGILNAIPGYLIRGENGGVVSYVKHLVDHTMRVAESYGSISKEPSDPWYGIADVRRSDLVESLRTMVIRDVIRPGPEHRCTGFKEIRYGPDRAPDLGAYLDFMEELFPGACFVFNERDVGATARSGFWATQPDAHGYLAHFLDRMRNTYDRGRGNYAWVNYDDYRDSPEALRPLFAFLGEEWEEDRLRHLMTRTHSTRTIAASTTS